MNIKTTLTHAAAAVALLSTNAFVAAQTGPTTQEAMKHSNPRAEAAAESRVESKGQAVDKTAKQPEAMKPGSDKAKVAAEAKVESKGEAVDKSAKQPEAMKPGSDKAKVAAEAKVARKPAATKKKSTDDQMSKDARKL